MGKKTNVFAGYELLAVGLLIFMLAGPTSATNVTGLQPTANLGIPAGFSPSTGDVTPLGKSNDKVCSYCLSDGSCKVYKGPSYCTNPCGPGGAGYVCKKSGGSEQRPPSNPNPAPFGSHSQFWGIIMSWFGL